METPHSKVQIQLAVAVRPPINCFLAFVFLEPCQKSMLFLILQVISDVLGNISTSNVAKTHRDSMVDRSPFFPGPSCRYRSRKA